MKYATSLIFALCLAAAGFAQNPYIAPAGASEQAGGIAVSDPRTMLAVDLTVECDATVCGPYARYAQKYLGVRAPLTDKRSYAVKSAAIALIDPAEHLRARQPEAPTVRVVAHAAADEEFARIQPDKTDMLTPSLEDAARNAANTIFSLRRHRLELITGEAGEHVFGEGLAAAMNEIARLEQSYLELFLGKRTVSTETRRFTVMPQVEKKQYILCRFNESQGLLPDNDLAGDIVLLQIEPSGDTASAVEASAKETLTMNCRVADPATCTVICGGREYGRTVLPVFEFGRTIKVALPRRK